MAYCTLDERNGIHATNVESTSYPAVGLIAHAVVLPLLTETLSFTYHSSFPRVRTLITIPCVPTLCKLPTTYRV